MSRLKFLITFVTTVFVSVATPATGAVGLGADAAAADHPVARSMTVDSMHRSSGDWRVSTTIDLSPESPADGELRYRVVGPLHGSLACDTKLLAPGASTNVEAFVTVGATAGKCRCTYEPDPGFTGEDRFTFQIAIGRDEAGFSDAATGIVVVNVRDRGVRWDLLTHAATAIDSASLPQDSLGGTTQDFLFVLNWQTRRPSRGIPETTDAARAGRLETAASWATNVLFTTGIVSIPQAVTVTEGTGLLSTTNPGVDFQRTFTFGGHVQLHGVFGEDGSGTSAEVGIHAGSDFNVPAQDGLSAREAAGQIVQVTREGGAHVRLEIGARFVVRQYRDDWNSIAFKPGTNRAVNGRNTDELLLIEVSLRKDNAFTKAPLLEAHGDPTNRIVFRAEAYPEVRRLSGNLRLGIGVEASRALSGGPWVTKITYGLRLSGNRLF